MAKNDFIHEMIANKVIAQLENGIVPWRKPWNSNTMPRSIDGHYYRGINAFILATSQFTSPYWMTLRAASRHGGQVKEDERENHTTVIYWRMLRIRDDATDEVKTIPYLQYYRVYNWEQTENVREPKGGAFPNLNTESADLVYDERHNRASEVARRYLNNNGPALTHGGDEAWYRVNTDHVQVPAIEDFSSLDEYYSTLFHEFGHSTGHPSRCDRKLGNYFGSHAYGLEELVAEMTATFTCSEAGIVSTFDNSAAYLAGWIKNIKEDPKSLVNAGSRAQHAFDRIMGIERGFDTEDVAA